MLAYAEPSYDILSGEAFLKLKGEGSAFQSLDPASKFVLAKRVAVGPILGTGLQNVPANRRFYPAAGSSVRGYNSQGIGPKDDTGKPTGGLSFFETSFEMRIAVTDRVGIVTFVDAGTVSNMSVPDFSDVKVGAGVGPRYVTPVGPLRIDAAIPLHRDPGDRKYGIYVRFGQGF
nr:BamA/TamA family outer membrane protein [Mesorhizobium sp.]